MMAFAIGVKCKRCGQTAKSEEFTLDPVYKMMVCPNCVKERKMNAISAKKKEQDAVKAQQVAEQKKQQPAGWDMEDVEINRAYSNKAAQQPIIEKIDDERMKYTCKKCKYSFTYYTLQKRPGRCPYCSTPVQMT